MFDNRVVYFHTHADDGKPRLIFHKWSFINKRKIELENERQNITSSSWKRINDLSSKAIYCSSHTTIERIWIAFWFDKKVH